MKISKTNSLLRLVAFLLITVVLIGIVGIVSEGKEKEPEENIENPPQNNLQTPPATDIPAVLQRYENYLSGLSCSLEESEAIPFCYLMSSSSPLYGIQDAELTIEFPIEFGQSRLLVYTSKTDTLGKIGAIVPARKYLSPLLSTFGGIFVHNGQDDTVNYYQTEILNQTIDLSKSNVYSYTEGYGQIYTNGNLISNAMENLHYETKLNSSSVLPYTFSSNLNGNIQGQYPAQNISIPFDTQNKASLVYNIYSGEYRCEKNGQEIIDYHTGENIYYKNVFVLFCDTTTYERADTTELVLETNNSGLGYYFTNGSMIKFNWETDSNGNLQFKDLSGEKLTINRGNSYIAFYKSTQKNSVTYY